MVQVLPRVKSSGERWGEALGGGINAFAKAFGEQQKQKRFGEALRGVEDVYSNPDLTPEQKYVKVFSLMREFPEQAKQFTSGMAQFAESPYQRAQRQRLEQETAEAKGEESYLNRLMGGGEQNQRQYQEPEEFEEIANAPGVIKPDILEGREKPKSVRSKPKQPKFDYNDPETWTDKQINEFRSLDGKTTKAKSLSKRAQIEFDRRKETKAATRKYEENVIPLQGALETLDRMEQIGKKGSLGIGTSVRGVFSPETRKDAAEYERLGKSLISFASNIPIRNRSEFETLAHDLYDPSISDASRAGILSAMKRIINTAMKAYQAPEGGEAYQPQGPAPTGRTGQQQRPSLMSFMR